MSRNGVGSTRVPSQMTICPPCKVMKSRASPACVSATGCARPVTTAVRRMSCANAPPARRERTRTMRFMAAGPACNGIAMARRLKYLDAEESKTMKPNDDEVRGKIDRAAGNVKERVGRATGDLDLQEEGADQRDAGTIEEGFGRMRRKTGEALRDLGNKINK